jgi:hypothetical protein
MEYGMWVLIFSTTFDQTVFHYKKNQRHIAINVKTSSCKVPDIVVRY